MCSMPSKPRKFPLPRGQQIVTHDTMELLGRFGTILQ